VLPRAAEACPNGLAPTTSTTMQMALGDALAVALLEARGFTAPRSSASSTPAASWARGSPSCAT
jgi:D-arabinose 5-phosphate isomerase GutQ